MAACDEDKWNIRLKIDGDRDDEQVSFRNINITGGIIVGQVRDRDDRLMSALRGTCRPSMSTGHADMSHLEFIFNVRDIREKVVMLRLEGVGYLQPGHTLKEFRGEFRAYNPYSGDAFSFFEVPASDPIDGRLHILAFDEGDTGTGHGQQT
jgi:hypothetical protein